MGKKRNLTKSKSAPDLEDLLPLLDNSLVVICTIDYRGRFLWVSQASLEVWGYAPEELTGTSYLDLVFPGDKHPKDGMEDTKTQRKEYASFENEYIHKNGSVVAMSWSVSWNAGQQIMYCHGRDQTKEKTARKWVEEKQEQLTRSMQLAKIGSWEYDVVKNEASWSDELVEIYGLNKDRHPKDILGTFLSMVHPDDLVSVERLLDQTQALPDKFRHRLIRPDGKVIILDQTITNKVIEEGITLFVAGTAQDITELLDNQEKLKVNETRFRSLVQNSSDLIGIIDAIGTYIYVADSCKELLGYDAGYFIGKNAFDFIHPGDAQKTYQQLSSLNNKKTMTLDPFRFQAATGDWKWIETKLTNRLEDPAINGIIINSTDITERKRAQDRFARLSKVAEETINIVIITDAMGKITWVNAAFSKVTGYDAFEVEGKKPGEILQGPDTNPATVAHMKAMILNGKEFDVEIINYTRDNIPYWVHIQCQPQFDDDKQIVSFFAIQTDITAKKQLENQLKQEVEKREKKITRAIVLAQEKERNEIGNELHDNVNQMLSTVKLYLGMINEPGPDKHDLISKSILHLQECIDEIRDISKNLSSPGHRQISLEKAVQELINSIALTGRVNIIYKPHNIDKFPINEDVELAIYRITQEHLTNILKHAKATEVQIFLLCIGNTLNLKIIDNGKGFDVRKKRKGIGISNMMNRAHAISGHLEINSTPGHGCTLEGSFSCV